MLNHLLAELQACQARLREAEAATAEAPRKLSDWCSARIKAPASTCCDGACESRKWLEGHY